MLKILIVDDEKLERKGICFLLQEKKDEIEILEASNGKEAVEVLKKEKIDILFTDIKMPFMNGIELVELAREIQPEIEMVIFSGYGEFEYARQAIKFGVTNYVLKPVDPEEFHRTVDQLFMKIGNRKRLKETNQNNRDSLEDYFLIKYLYQGNEELLVRIKDKVDLKGWEQICGLFLVESDDNFFEESEDVFAVGLLEKFDQKLSFLNLSQNQELCVLKSHCDQKVLARRMISEINEKFGEKFYLALSREVKQIEELPTIFKELDSLMENKFYRKSDRLFLGEKPLQETISQQAMGDILNKMIEDIQLEDMAHLWEHYGILKESMGNFTQYSQIYTKFMFSSLVKEFYTHSHTEGPKLEEAIQTIYGFQSIQDVMKMVEELISDMEKQIEDRQNGTRDEVSQAKSYIYEHYNEDLSVEILAEKVYLSPGYFSYIFKRKTGVNLSRFVRVYRLEKAKELLEKTNMKIVQVCKETGFSNVSYFCKSFREYCGCSPEQFRKGEGADE